MRWDEEVKYDSEGCMLPEELKGRIFRVDPNGIGSNKRDKYRYIFFNDTAIKLVGQEERGS